MKMIKLKNRILPLIIVVAILFSGCIVKDLATNDQLCAYGCPQGAPASNIVVEHDILVLSANIETKFADWVYYKVVSNNLNGKHNDRNWAQDPAIPEEYTFIPSDYHNAEDKCSYDRGHQAALASFTNSNLAFQANYLSNITPQHANLNQGSWEKLEEQERKLTAKYNEVVIFTGPYYTSEMTCQWNSNPRIKYTIPNGYWKVIVVTENDKVKIASFKFSQDTAKGSNYCDHKISMDDLMTTVKLKLLPRVNFNRTALLYEDLGCHEKAKTSNITPALQKEY